MEGSRGIGRYIAAVLDCTRAVPIEIASFTVPSIGPSRLRQFIEMPLRQQSMRRVGLMDLYHAPTPFQAPLRTAVPWVCSVLDLIPMDVSTHRRTGAKTRFFYCLATAADAVLTLSEHSKSRIVEVLQIDPAKVVVASLPPAPAFRSVAPEDIARVADALGIRERYVVALADTRAPDPRKRLPWLHTVAERVDELGLQVVVVGPGGRQSADLGGQSSLHMVGYVEDDVLAALYSGAECLIYPTAYEGQGLPAIEAISCGTPVVAPAACSLPEMVGEAGLLVPEVIDDPSVAAAGPHSPQDEGARRFADAAVRFLGDSDRMAQARAAARAQVNRFTAARFAENVYRAYEMALTHA